MNSMLFLAKKTKQIEDFNTLLLFLTEENFSDIPTYVFFKIGNVNKRIHLDQFGLCYYDQGIRKDFSYKQGMVFAIETEVEKEIRLSLTSIAMCI